MAHSARMNIDQGPAFVERWALDFGFEVFLERHEVASWGVFSLLYVIWTTLVSNHKQLWFDELVIYAVDHGRGWGEAWHYLKIGVDANPPLFHLVNRLFLGAFGDTNLVQRGSSILGFWAMSLCVYLIVRRQRSAAAAWVAALIPACSGAAYYATEARPYGMVLGFVGLGFLCWVRLAEGAAGRRWWLAGLSLALAGAISSHYFAVFAVGPFVGAELTRGWKRSKVDWAVLGAALLGLWPLAVFYFTGLIAAAGQYAGNAESVSLLAPFAFWEYLLGPVAGSLVVAGLLAAGWGWMTGRRAVVSLQFSDSVLLAAWFCVLPVVVAVGARYVTHAYEFRYGISAVIGAAVLLGAAWDTVRLGIPGTAGLAVLALLLPVAADATAGAKRPRGRHVEYGWAAVVGGRPELPVVYGGPLESVQAWYNAPTAELKGRITTLVDVAEGWKRTHNVTADLGVINLRPALATPARGYGEFVGERRPFYLIHQPAIVGWVMGRLLEDGAQMQLKGTFGGDEVYLVTWGPVRDGGPLGR